MKGNSNAPLADANGRYPTAGEDPLPVLNVRARISIAPSLTEDMPAEAAIMAEVGAGENIGEGVPVNGKEC